MDVIGWDAAPGSAGLVALFGHGSGGGGGASHGGGTSRGGGRASGVQVTAHERWAMTRRSPPQQATRGHRHFASPFDIRHFGTGTRTSFDARAKPARPRGADADVELTAARAGYITSCSEGSCGRAS